MKYLVSVCLLTITLSVKAQIVLEHTYEYTNNFGLIEVDSEEWKYVAYNGSDSILLYNMDHSFDRVILARLPSFPGWRLYLLSRRLFDLDSAYECLFATEPYGHVRIFNEAGNTMFSCDSCALGLAGSPYSNDVAIEGSWAIPIKSTPQGSKMLVTRSYPRSPYVEVYSLPGKLTRCLNLSVTSSAEAVDRPMLPTSAYPNPSTGQVRIAYELPEGVSTGDIILTTEDGKGVKRYHVTDAFNDLLIEESDLPSGSYFYKLVTEKGESAAKRIVSLK